MSVPVARETPPVQLASNSPPMPSLMTSASTTPFEPYSTELSVRVPAACDATTPVASDTRLMAATSWLIDASFWKLNTSRPIEPPIDRTRSPLRTLPPVVPVLVFWATSSSPPSTTPEPPAAAARKDARTVAAFWIASGQCGGRLLRRIVHRDGQRLLRGIVHGRVAGCPPSTLTRTLLKSAPGVAAVSVIDVGRSRALVRTPRRRQRTLPAPVAAR